MDPSENGHDPVAANRTAHPRRTPGRVPVGAQTTRRLTLAMAAIVVVATAVLIWAITSAP